eukprot:scaffold7194_cov181-Ochromonas_danica.AAC.2
MDELEQVKRDIAQAKEDLERAKALGDRELELIIRESINLLMRKEERLTSSSVTGGVQVITLSEESVEALASAVDRNRRAPSRVPQPPCSLDVSEQADRQELA